MLSASSLICISSFLNVRARDVSNKVLTLITLIENLVKYARYERAHSPPANAWTEKRLWSSFVSQGSLTKHLQCGLAPLGLRVGPGDELRRVHRPLLESTDPVGVPGQLLQEGI